MRKGRNGRDNARERERERERMNRLRVSCDESESSKMLSVECYPLEKIINLAVFFINYEILFLFPFYVKK